MKLLKILSLSILLGSLSPTLFAHGHINAGASGNTLIMFFEEGTQTTVLAPNSGTNGYGLAGYEWNGFTTITALHQSSYPAEAPYYNPAGALSGSYLRMELVSITGPAGGQFAFFESAMSSTNWVYEIGTGLTSGNGYITLTEDSWFNDPVSDPFGHIHERMFGVNTAGTYTATWRLVDTQSATTGMLDSATFETTYTAVPEPGTYALIALGGALLIMRRRRKTAHV